MIGIDKVFGRIIATYSIYEKRHREYSESEQRLLIFFAQMLVNIRLRKLSEEQIQKANFHSEGAMMHIDSAKAELTGKMPAMVIPWQPD